MELFILRHGEAEPYAVRDAERQLTSWGREQLTRVLTESAEALKAVTLVVTSPYIRAQQTCQVALNYVPATAADYLSLDFLTPDSNPQQVFDWLSGITDSVVLLVSHQPLVGTIVEELCGLDHGSQHMGTGALASIKMDVVARGMGELQWLRQV